MSNLKPIGSEKLTGQDKINRIMEIARFNEVVPKSINEMPLQSIQFLLPTEIIIKLLEKDKGILSRKPFQNLKRIILNL